MTLDELLEEMKINMQNRDLSDDYLEEHRMTDFLPVILDIYKVSGLIRSDAPKEEVEKNVEMGK